MSEDRCHCDQGKENERTTHSKDISLTNVVHGTTGARKSLGLRDSHEANDAVEDLDRQVFKKKPLEDWDRSLLEVLQDFFCLTD